MRADNLHVTEHDDCGIRSIVADMREQASAKREQSRALHAANKHDRAFACNGEAVVIEHWAMRLEGLIPPAGEAAQGGGQ